MNRRKKAAASKEETQMRLKGMLDSLDNRCKVIEGRINDCNKRLMVQKKEIKKATASKSKARQKVILKSRKQAQRILQQRKLFENQLDQLRNQEANVHNQMFQLENMEFAAQQAKAMKATKEAMKKMKLDVEDVAELKDATMNYQADLDEVNELLGEAPGGMDLDDEDLQLELDMLDDGYQETTPAKRVPANKTGPVRDELDLELELLEEFPEVPEGTQESEARKAVKN